MSAVDTAEALVRKGGRVHLMGIGGIGMAGVAWLLKERGFQVSGCDLQENRQTIWLSSRGVHIDRGHDRGHVVHGVDWLIRSTAVPDSHPEVERARALGIPVSRRGEVLPALMRDRVCIAVSGTHGKTTTTAMIAQVLGCGFCVGGEIAGFDGAVARDGRIMVVEADESDGTVAGYTPDYSVITNIEYDHMEHHASEEAFVGCFEALIEQTGNTVFYCGEDRLSAEICRGVDKCEAYYSPDTLYELPLAGAHNQLNASGVESVCATWLSEAEIRKRLAGVRSIARRFEMVFDDGRVRVVSDYAHHPTEIRALISAAKELGFERCVGVFQPHRYTRTMALGPDFPSSFDGLDKLWLLPVYAASECSIPGGTSADLAERFPAEWKDRLLLRSEMRATWEEIAAELDDGDLLLIIGAGDIEKMAVWAAGLQR